MKPFVSHDGADNTGVRAEVFVQTGTGTVTGIEDRGTNVQVLVKSDIESVRRPVKGWLSKSDSLYDMVVEAQVSGRTITYRTESQRNQGVDRNIPIADLRKTTELAGDNTKNLFTGLDGSPSSEAVTNPDEDPAGGGRIKAGGVTPSSPSPVPAAVGEGNCAAALAGLATARFACMGAGVVDAATALALMSGATAQQVQDAGFVGQHTSNTGVVQRAFSVESPAFKEVNSDQRQNLGSYAVQAAFGAERVGHRILTAAALVVWQELKDGIADGSEEGPAPAEPRPAKLGEAITVSGILLELADRVQVGAYGGGRPDRMVLSHARARSLVFDAVEFRFPWPYAGSPDEVVAWQEAVVDECVERFTALAAVATSGTFADVSQAQTATTNNPPVGAPRRPASLPASREVEATVTTPAPAKKVAIIEGEEGFTEPSPAVIARFGALAKSAGFVAGPGSPLALFLKWKFRVNLIRQINGAELDQYIAYFEKHGPDAGSVFRGVVEKAPSATV